MHFNFYVIKLTYWYSVMTNCEYFLTCLESVHFCCCWTASVRCFCFLPVPAVHGTTWNWRHQFLPVHLWIPGKTFLLYSVQMTPGLHSQSALGTSGTVRPAIRDLGSHDSRHTLVYGGRHILEENQFSDSNPFYLILTLSSQLRKEIVVICHFLKFFCICGKLYD